MNTQPAKITLPKHWLPAWRCHVTGTVRTNYFFGKAVDRAEVVVKASAMDVSLVDAAKTSGTTDGDGAFSFDMRLPDFFAGKAAQAIGAARVFD